MPPDGTDAKQCAQLSGVYDIYVISDSAADALGRTMAAAIKTARFAYRYNSTNSAKVYMTTSKGSSDKPLLFIVPPGFDAGKDVKLHIHFHGDSATISDVVGDGGLSGSIKDLQAAEPQRIVILPECINPSYATPGGSTPSYSPMWSNISDLTVVQDDVRKAVCATSVASGGYVVSGHSGGGHGISVAMAADLASKAGRAFRANQIRLLDCLHYNSKDSSIEDTLVKWAKAHPSEVASVLAVRGVMGRSPDVWGRVKKAFTDGGATTSYKEIEVLLTHDPLFVPEPTVPYDPDPTGTPQPRWNLSPGKRVHARARSQYLGQD